LLLFVVFLFSAIRWLLDFVTFIAFAPFSTRARNNGSSSSKAVRAMAIKYQFIPRLVF